MEIRYRSEIDGLRTLAVLSVIIYHAEFVLGSGKLLAGGFLGVDIFFVISGFLITSLMMSEFHHTGTISIANFYERRARRLLPALLVVMLASLPFAWFYLLPEQLIDFCNSLISSLFFGSNFYWNYSLQQYGAESALLKPFLHTWSLAVEEQYYIAFPLLLLAAFRWCKSHIFLLLAVGLLFSLLFADWMTPKDASFSFYMLPSRVWELLAGGVLAYFLNFYPQNENNSFLNKAMPKLGFILVLYSVLFTEFDSNHPGFTTLIPVIGTMLIIGFASKGEVITRILSSKAFVLIGLISYSLYLWHYPIFAFLRIESLFSNYLDKVIAIVATFLCSMISYRFIETFFRSSALVPNRFFITFISAFVLIIGIFSYYGVESNGYAFRYPPIISNIETNILKDKICKEGLHCSFNERGTKKLFLVGDSHMMTLESSLLKYSKDNGINLNVLNAPGCQYILKLERVSKTSGAISKCSSKLQKVRQRVLLSSDPSIVILGGRLPLILSEDRFDNQEGAYEGEMKEFLQYDKKRLSSHEDRRKAIFIEYKKTVLELANYGHQVILIYPIPEVGWNVPKRLKHIIQSVPPNKIESELSKKPITTSFDVYQERSKDSFSLLDGIMHRNISRVYPHRLFCNTVVDGRCVTHDLENSYYRDDDHLSSVGASMLMNEISMKLGMLIHN